MVTQKPDKKLLFDLKEIRHPKPGSADECTQFKKLQEQFAEQFPAFYPDDLCQKTIVVIPSLTLDQAFLSKVDGAMYYEERMLCLLMLLRMPRAQIVYVSSLPIDAIIVDYYLHLLPGITGCHARDRLLMLSCYDSSAISLTQKILARPRLMNRIKNSIPPWHVAHIACFNTTGYEQSLAVRLGLPVYGCDPALCYLGTKSGSRRLFIHLGLEVAPGIEFLHTAEEVKHAVSGLKDMYPSLKKAVVKLNDGFSGDGNAIVEFPEGITNLEMFNWVHHKLEQSLQPVAKDLTPALFFAKLLVMGGVVESFIEGEEKYSPSVQCRIDPLGEIEIISTHDQALNGQVFSGAHFPANAAYRHEITALARDVAEELKAKGVIGRFGIDFISVKEAAGWKHYAVEINLRKGGTTHPFLMLQFLTNGSYDELTGIYQTANGQARFYYASDNVQKDQYKGLVPQDLINIAMFHGLHFDGATQKGVVFHMIGALSQYGKMGMVCIGESPEEAVLYYERAIAVLDAETSPI